MIESALRGTFYPLGFPFCVSTNSSAVLEIVRSEFGVWERAFDVPPAHLEIEVTTHPERERRTAEFHGHRHLFAFIADSQNFAICDSAAGTGKIQLTNYAAADPAYVHYHFLDGVVSLLIESPYLSPIHAACVSRGSQGVLLCGDSGAGKSTLSYACARRGWTYVTDDGSYLIRARSTERLVAGNSHRMRMRPESTRLFPELARFEPSMRGNGKLTIELWTRDLASITACPTAEIERFVFLRRKSEGPARLSPFSKSDARAWCEQVYFRWNPPVGAEQEAGISTLIDACEVQALEYAHLEDAVDALER